MKNRNWKKNRLRVQREKSFLKKSRQPRLYIDASTSPYAREYQSKLKADSRRIENFKFDLDEFLNKKGNIFTDDVSEDIMMPKIFCLEKNYKEVIVKLSEIRTTLISMKFESVRLNFTKTNEVSFEVLFLIKVITEEYLKFLKKSENRLEALTIFPTVKIRRSNCADVNTKLYANKIIRSNYGSEDELDLNPVSQTSLFQGSKMRKSYDENKKGSAGGQIRRLIDRGLSSHGYCLNEKGVNNLDGIISEVLNNAEDHSPFETWYTFGNLFESVTKSDEDNFVGQINLAFLNFGYSIYEGFEDSKEENSQLYQYMTELTENIQNIDSSYRKDSLFTLYALQDGYSRLKGTQESRGTGTMKFINSFLYLGDYSNEEKGYAPKLIIYSGKTTLICDNKFRPFEKDGAYFLSLNRSNDLNQAPEKSHLIENDINFPGTFLVVKIYLNRNHLMKKVEEGGEKN